MYGNTTFGLWLKQVRQDRHISVNRFSQQLHCSASLLTKIEKGERRPSDAFLKLLYKLLSPEQTKQAQGLLGEQQPTHSQRIPQPRTKMIGRRQNLAVLRRLITKTKAPLISLVGPPGVGKTRVALQLAKDLDGYFQHAVYVVDLSAAIPREGFEQTLRQAFQCSPSESQPLINQLAQRVGNQPSLLILDNGEQRALDQIGPYIVQILEHIPSLQIIITSRIRLYVRTEQVIALEPFPLPALDAPWERLKKAEAIQLFVDRVQAYQPNFELTPQNSKLIAQICAAVDGLPLAIELAAAHLDHCSLEKLLHYVQQRVIDLTTTLRDMPVRLRSVREAIQSSFEPLDLTSQRHLMLLSVFQGGWRTDAARWMWGYDTSSEQIRDEVRERIRRLGHASWINFNANTNRPSLLTIFRMYLQEELQQRRLWEAARQRHAEYYQQICQQAALGLVGEERTVWIQSLTTEFGNLSVAINWWMDSQQAEQAAQMIIHINEYWSEPSAFQQIRPTIENLLHQQSLSLLLQARLHLILGAYLRDHEPAYATRHLMQSINFFRELEAPIDLNRALSIVSTLPPLPAEGEQQSRHVGQPLHNNS